MNIFQCQHCGQPLYFENNHCEGCNHRLGYLPSKEVMAALEEDRGLWRPLALMATARPCRGPHWGAISAQSVGHRVDVG